MRVSEAAKKQIVALELGSWPKYSPDPSHLEHIFISSTSYARDVLCTHWEIGENVFDVIFP